MSVRFTPSLLAAGVLATATLAATAASAVPFTLTLGPGVSTSSNPSPTGASAEVFFADFTNVAGGVEVDLQITNTTDPTFGSNLTAFIFDTPDAVTGLSFAGSAPTTGLDVLLSGVSFPPFGDFDFAVVDNSSLLGGQPSGLTAGETQALDLFFSTSLSADTLMTTLLTGFDDGLEFAARFQEVGPAGALSDKLLGGDVQPIPLPAAAWLLLGGLGGLGLLTRKRRAA